MRVEQDKVKFSQVPSRYQLCYSMIASPVTARLILTLTLCQILKLRGQAEEQEQSLKVQEEEVHSKKRELDVLIEEEVKLNNDIKKSQKEMENLVRSLSDVEKLLEEVGLYWTGQQIKCNICANFRRQGSVQSMRSWRLISMRPPRDLTKYWAPQMKVWLKMFRKCIWSRSDTLSLSQTSPCWTSPTSHPGRRLPVLSPRPCRTVTDGCLPLTIPLATRQSRLLRQAISSTTMMHSLLLTTRHRG